MATRPLVKHPGGSYAHGTIGSPHGRSLAHEEAKTSPRQAAAAQSTRPIARNAMRGGPKSVKKDKRGGAGRAAKG
jgi:hypothetical protein